MACLFFICFCELDYTLSLQKTLGLNKIQTKRFLIPMSKTVPWQYRIF